MDVTFASPLAALGGLIGTVPLAIAFLRIRSARRLRRQLGLEEPSRLAQLGRPIALACVFALLGLAAARPSIDLNRQHTARADAQLLVVLDSSRSMLAARSPTSPPRYRRAVAFARRLHAAMPQLPTGISSLTNRLLPYLFPTSDTHAFDLVLDQAYGIERPPPALTADNWVTTFEPLNEISVRHFFSPSATKRVVVILSDVEVPRFDARSVLAHLREAGTTPIVVRFWRPDERIFGPGPADKSYRATQPGALTTLHDAGWPTFRETDFPGVARLVRRTIGTGRLVEVGYSRQTASIAPIVALAAFAPLLLLAAPASGLSVLRPRRRSRSEAVRASRGTTPR